MLRSSSSCSSIPQQGSPPPQVPSCACVFIATPWSCTAAPAPPPSPSPAPPMPPPTPTAPPMTPPPSPLTSISTNQYRPNTIPKMAENMNSFAYVIIASINRYPSHALNACRLAAPISYIRIHFGLPCLSNPETCLSQTFRMQEGMIFHILRIGLGQSSSTIIGTISSSPPPFSETTLSSLTSRWNILLRPYSNSRPCIFGS
mmetsp:Transcript_19436/g.32838  ORF Transcript_19436/g.32838 Transcript_19436/m.32838 type:complete len:202 (+) Transcript_19436:1793-2398(+)